ncbi:MAG: hypothetical protein WCE93_08800 [Nitrososphaeraceae archaeon]|jgi:hypothetical protein
MNKLTFVAVCLALSFGISFAMITPSVMGQPTYMNQSGINMSAPETAENAVPGNDTTILENDTSIGNPNNTIVNSMGTNENQSN